MLTGAISQATDRLIFSYKCQVCLRQIIRPPRRIIRPIDELFVLDVYCGI